ncbi:MAG: hypothetical protein IPP66_06355 [Anaerolineales bacterium]|nr:hypothetical protein [Anaerolineales bacterium]
MKIYKYWTIEKQAVLIDGNQQEVVCYGGSNISPEDARARAKEKAQKIQRKIMGEKHLFEDYEVEIREELLQEIDPHAIVTRNRYGARVLNVENMMILDIDKPKSTGGLAGLFKKKDTRPPKEQIFDMVKTLAVTKYPNYAFRIYETYQGARVIVLGRDFDPRDRETKKMMDEFNCDPLYTMLCVKQGCYRARLTPKPSRMKLRGYKVKYPREGDDSEFQRWVSEYESLSRSFSVCKFIGQVGTGYGGSEVIRFHDDVTGVGYPQKLA